MLVFASVTVVSCTFCAENSFYFLKIPKNNKSSLNPINLAFLRRFGLKFTTHLKRRKAYLSTVSVSGEILIQQSVRQWKPFADDNEANDHKRQ